MGVWDVYVMLIISVELVAILVVHGFLPVLLKSWCSRWSKMEINWYPEIYSIMNMCDVSLVWLVKSPQKECIR